MAQPSSFHQAVNRLFFGVDVSVRDASLRERFISAPGLRYKDTAGWQRNLDISRKMNGSPSARAETHRFYFTRIPLVDLPAKEGVIELRIGRADTRVKLLDLAWQVGFENGQQAGACFERLQQVFQEVAVNMEVRSDPDLGSMAAFSAGPETNAELRNISFLLGRKPGTNAYAVFLILGNILAGD